jgi:hypothetical protein
MLGAFSKEAGAQGVRGSQFQPHVLRMSTTIVKNEAKVMMNLNICRSQSLGREGFLHLVLKSGRAYTYLILLS